MQRKKKKKDDHVDSEEGLEGERSQFEEKSKGT
jgi:hypothetical protein